MGMKTWVLMSFITYVFLDIYCLSLYNQHLLNLSCLITDLFPSSYNIKLHMMCEW